MPAEGVRDTVRDVLLAFALVGVVLGGMTLYSGGAWPPIIVVESGSMMRCDARGPGCAAPPDGVPYGRYGTIDPGDIVVQKAVRGKDDVRTWAQGGPLQYGKPGDVIVYYPYNNTNATPIIHRAMAWVDVVQQPGGNEYRVEWVDGETLVFDARGIYLPELGFDERAGLTREAAYRPPVSGFITKGDNPVTNDRADQAGPSRDERLTDLVQPGWIIGKARGEVPWFGLLKLVVAPDINEPNPAWMRVGNAFAPYDLWTMLGVSIGLVVVAPLAYDVARAWREQRAIRRDLERAERRERAAREEPTPFEPVE